MGLDGSLPYGRDGISNGAFPIIMHMDAKRAVYRLLDGPHDLGQFPRHGSTVGIAQHHRLSSSARSRLQGFERIARIRLIAIKEMFSIVDHPPALRLEISQALLYDA